MINSEQIQALKAAAEKATPGDWWIDSHGSTMVSFSDKDDMEVIFVTDGLKMGPAIRHESTGNLSHWRNDNDATFIATANPAAILSLLAERDADKALIAEQAERIAELECVCAESYQVVGALADSFGVFNDTKTIKALDNLSAQMLVHTDVLPFSVESSTLTVKLPPVMRINEPGVSFNAYGQSGVQNALYEACAAAGITLVVVE